MQPNWELADHQLFECRSGSLIEGVEVLIEGALSTRALTSAILWAARSQHIPESVRFILMDLPTQSDAAELVQIAECAENAGLGRRLCLVCPSQGLPRPDTPTLLHKLGIRVVLGGVGPHCRLVDLIEPPLDGLLFDRDFVEATAGDPCAACALDALVNLAKNLGIATFASRVELPAAFDIVSAAGVDYVTTVRRAISNTAAGVLSQ